MSHYATPPLDIRASSADLTAISRSICYNAAMEDPSRPPQLNAAELFELATEYLTEASFAQTPDQEVALNRLARRYAALAAERDLAERP
jgi:hypothetical protein